VKAKKLSKENMSYEDALQQLEEIVQQLEQGDVPLEQSLLVYQEGVALLAYCQKILGDVESKLTILNDAKGEE
jgi:exodeoxyribonuclease VII small subunit